jgi:hypothetical protein
VWVAISVVLALTGCRRDRELTRMQAEVNRAATELVVQDAEARRQWMSIRQQFDEDRRQLAREQRRDPIIAQAILQIGGIGLCLLPLWLIARLLRRNECDPVFHPIDDLVIDELIGHTTSLLPSIERDSPPSCPPARTSACPPRSASGSGPAGAQPDLNALIDGRLQHRRE